MNRTAALSTCGTYRYRLGRRWAEGSTLLFVMLNPSTADADIDDPTIRRCIGFAQRGGFGALEVVNLYAYRATKPQDLRNAGYPVGPDNDHHIVSAASDAATVCVAWGANVAGLKRPDVVLPLLRRVGMPITCLSITRSGYPGHPLFLPSSCTLHDFSIDAIQEAMST